MSANADKPIEGNWYELPSGKTFTVVTIDEDDKMVEIQYDDESLDAIELEDWDDLGVDPISPPDVWIDDYDETGRDDDDYASDYDVDPDDIEED